MTTRDHLLTERPLKRETIEVDGQPVIVQEFDGEGWGDIQQELAERQNGKRASVGLLNVLFAIHSVVDEQGEYVFTLDDIPALQKQPSRILAPIVNVVQAMSGLQDADMVESAKNA